MKRVQNFHGMCDTPTYTSWVMMHQRCSNPRATGYDDYGGRGITVCKRWRRFENFYADMGVRPEGMTLDRLNNDGNYTPKNCRWATRVEQRSNRRKNAVWDGMTHTEVARMLNVSPDTLLQHVLRSRYDYGVAIAAINLKIKKIV